jgi:hypothetical protein
MQHDDVSCSTCGRRLRLVGQSSETCGDRPGPVARYYRCPNCGAKWTHDRKRDMIGPAVPDHLTQAEPPLGSPTGLSPSA